MLNVRNKGKTAELEVIKLFRETMVAIEAWFPPDVPRYSHRLQRNSLQFGKGGFDVAGLPGIALEIKRCETLQLASWWEQCVRQAIDAGGLMPVLCWRQSRQPWNVKSWLQLTDGQGTNEFVVGSYTLAEFLKWYSRYYQRHLELTLRTLNATNVITERNDAATQEWLSK